MKEVKEWSEKAEKDLKRAELLFSNEDFEGCAFHSHQAAEKALKALYILKFKRLWKTHDLKEIARRIRASQTIIKIGDALNPHYISTRYPVKVIYTREMAEEALKNAKKVIEWTKKKLKK